MIELLEIEETESELYLNGCRGPHRQENLCSIWSEFVDRSLGTKLTLETDDWKFGAVNE